MTLSTVARGALISQYYTARNFDDNFFSECKFLGFNPSTRTMPSNVDVLASLVSPFGPGATRLQFRRVMRRCNVCNNICFIDRRHLHRCRGQVLPTQEHTFDLVDALTSYKEHTGLSRFDLFRLFARCSECENICMEGSLHLHICP